MSGTQIAKHINDIVPMPYEMRHLPFQCENSVENEDDTRPYVYKQFFNESAAQPIM